MSKASDILNKSKLTASEILDPESPKMNEANMYGNRIVSCLIDTAARYRSTQKLEYRLNLLMTAVLYTAASAIQDDSDKSRLISIANTLNREFGNLKELSDLDTLATSIYDKVR